MKALATIGVGPMAPLLDIALTTFRPYAARHGYDVVVGSGESAGRPSSWGKVLLLQRLVESYDEVLWLDSDMIIADDAVDIASVVPEDAFQAMVLQREHDGGVLPNSGLWFVRSRDETRDFLANVWTRGDHGDERGMWDNMAVLDLLGYTTEKPHRLERSSAWASGTHQLPEEWNFFAVGTESPPGTRILHFCAMANEKRVRLMRLAALKAPHSDNGSTSPWVRRLEWQLRRAELSLYFRRRGVRDRSQYLDGRFTSSGAAWE